MTTPQPGLLREIPAGTWIALATLVLAGALLFHAAFPRYVFQVVGNEGKALVIYDRWSGRFQRVNYDEHGEPSLTKVVTPF